LSATTDASGVGRVNGEIEHIYQTAGCIAHRYRLAPTAGVGIAGEDEGNGRWRRSQGWGR
jgi:hypothetical protein